MRVKRAGNVVPVRTLTQVQVVSYADVNRSSVTSNHDLCAQGFMSEREPPVGSAQLP